MILVDTSIWIDHLNRGGNDRLVALLEEEGVVVHRFVVGEIALGSLKNRSAQLGYLRALPSTSVASETEVAALIEWGDLHGTGIGYVDAHLLAAARAANGVKIWTRDKRLHAQATRLALAAEL